MTRRWSEAGLPRGWGVAGAAIAAAGLLAYGNTFSCPFVFDDLSSITHNPTIRHLWPPWDALWTPHVSVTAEGRPVLNLSLAINYAISGPSVWSYHVANLLIHVLAGLTLFGILRRTLVRLIGRSSVSLSPPKLASSERRIGAAAPLSPTVLAACIALIWTVHPIQTESVTYVIQRAESMMGLFYLLTLYCFIRGVDAEEVAGRSGLRWYALSVLACLFGMGTKEVMATAPLMALLYDRTFAAGSFIEALRRRFWCYVGLAATWVLLGYLVLSGGGDRNGTFDFTVHGLWRYGLTQFEAIARYLRVSVWPHPLVFEYGAFTVKRPEEALPYVPVVAALVAATVHAFWRRPALGFLGCWFLLILSVTSLVPGNSQMIVEHRMYLPLAAVVAAGVLGIHALLGRLSLSLILGLAVVLGVLTHRRNKDYRSELGLWELTIAQRPNNALAHTMLGDALKALGRDTEAFAQYEETIRLMPDFALAYDDLGDLLVKWNRIDEAMARYREALRFKPDFVDAHNGLGAALARKGRFDEAIAQFQQTLAIEPNYPEAEYNLARALSETGRGRESISHYQAAIRLRPDFVGAYYNLANTLMNLGRADEAIPEYEAALRLRPDHPEAHYNLGNALASLSRQAEAVPHYEEAIRLRPRYAEAHCNLGSALFDLGRLAEAEAQYEETLRIDPGFSDARANLERLRALGSPGRR